MCINCIIAYLSPFTHFEYLHKYFQTIIVPCLYFVLFTTITYCTKKRLILYSIFYTSEYSRDTVAKERTLKGIIHGKLLNDEMVFGGWINIIIIGREWSSGYVVMIKIWLNAKRCVSHEWKGWKRVYWNRIES